ncbi:MAG: ATP-dependent RecD-like DNA helicase, partial [Flavobacteriales bacterium]
MSDAFSSSSIFDTFEARLASHFPHAPTAGQARLFYAFKRFMFSDKGNCALLLKGYAGTGKTSSVIAMVNTLEELGIACVLLAPTGRAAKVLSSYTRRSAWTIHRHIYQMTSEGGFFLRENPAERTVYFIDESSMIGSGIENQGTDLLDDLMTFVYQGEGCRAVFIGDQAQLPPVGSAESPALQLEYLRRIYALNIAEVVLDKVVRQARNSGILAQATKLRDQMLTDPTSIPKLSRKV